MKKLKTKIKYLILAFLALIIVYPTSANAELCTKSTYNDLVEKAASIKTEWELKFDEKNNYYFEVTASNIDSELMLVFGGSVYEPNEDGNITVSTPLEGGNNYSFKFYGAYYNPCAEEYIYTKNLKIPKYNKYSEYEECKEYSEWELCDKWYDGVIEDDNDFYEKLEGYKKGSEQESISTKDTTNSKINIIIIVAIIVIMIIFTSQIIIKLKKKKKRQQNTK